LEKKANAREQAEKARKMNVNFFEKLNLDRPITEMW
jgi:hypothetical protein